MRRPVITVCLIACGFAPHLVAAADPPHDPIQESLVSPDLLMQRGHEIGLTETQLQRIRGHLMQVAEEAARQEKSAKQQMQKMADMLKAPRIDESAVMKQLDQVLAAENDLKRLHLRAMLQVNKELTHEQRRQAAMLKPATDPDQLRTRLQAKLARIEREVQKRARSGVPPRDAVQMMQSFQQHMQAARHGKAEEILNRVLEVLNIPQEVPDSPPAGTSPTGNQSEEKKKQQDDTAWAPQPEDRWLSPAAVREQVATLKEQDIGWREIQWRTCLLQGLKESRQQQKPLLLWVFIDRPVDDERC